MRSRLQKALRSKLSKVQRELDQGSQGTHTETSQRKTLPDETNQRTSIALEQGETGSVLNMLSTAEKRQVVLAPGEKVLSKS